MTREAVTVPAHPHRAPWRRVQRALLFPVPALWLWSVAGAPALVHAQWLGLPDPPDPPDEIDCVACTGEAEGPAPTPPTPATTPTAERPRPPWARHEFTVGTAFALTSIIVRRSTFDDAQYRIALARRDAVLQASSFARVHGDEAVRTFRALKQRCDPDGLLQTDLSRRLLG